MSESILTAIITTSGTVLIAITALIQNSKPMERIEKQLDVIQADLKEFYKSLSEHDKRIQRFEDK